MTDFDPGMVETLDETKAYELPRAGRRAEIFVLPDGSGHVVLLFKGNIADMPKADDVVHALGDRLYGHSWFLRLMRALRWM